MTNFENAFYGLNKTKSNELNTIINNVDTLNDNLETYITETELTTALGDYETTAALTTTLTSYATVASLADYAKIVTAPASATATGVAGQIAYDATNIYVCVATDTWVKATLATWT